QHEKEKRDAGQRQDRAQSVAEGIAPDEGEKFHALATRAPFSSMTVRAAQDAAFGSCVTITIAFLNSVFSRFRRTRTSSSLFLSRSPVGSSASSSVGSVTIARAIATRFSWPPESWRGV